VNARSPSKSALIREIRGANSIARKVMERCDALGKISEEPDRLTRTFLSPAMRQANQLVNRWMREAGLNVHQDSVFNLIGRWPSARRNARTLILGSHLDTVRDAGKYDGPLGVLVGIAAVEKLRTARVNFPFHLEVVGFCDEEGVRYQSTYLGSRALAGRLTKADLSLRDSNGIMLRDSGIGNVATARRLSRATLGYVEVHIEQGPVLEARNLALGVVGGIAGQTRATVEFVGRAGHAGTTPMDLRKDALTAAAEFILAVEANAVRGLLATVGQLTVQPGASNVIPGATLLSVDVRHQSDAARRRAVQKLRNRASRIARRRGLRCTWRTLQETSTVVCDKNLTQLLGKAVRSIQGKTLVMPSGAGHDAAAMATLCPIGMLFVRCKGGVSHHPGESVKQIDVAAAIAALTGFLVRMKSRHV
jgi:allantoate deiminase